MSKTIIASIVILLALVAGTYFYFHGKEYVIRVSEPEIRVKLDEKLPFTKTYLFIIQVTLSNPRVTLVNGTNRVNAGLDATLNITINKNPKPLGGTIDASGQVKYMSENGQFFLIDPVIDKLEIQGIPEKYIAKVTKALGKALAEYFENNPIYSLSALDSKQAVARMVLKDVVIENKELVVTLGI